MLLAREKVAAAGQAGLGYPDGNRNPGRLGECEANGLTGLLLDR
jgi:hypothetical protein